ncbi:hypothetical protein [Williamwhitmania taraxaci]|uniref:YbbD head domain-containing protein n=1 Tax=Williamwhitmania taraxaci TaxID=1640674 RepID=A0A1G6HS98_9BACT|nr:hypothetical protein [Williamwhitmania taraxaci]SDB97159.1 hypothetical protein SAMN05216323_10133 [Williamwhitmania taraxaci]
MIKRTLLLISILTILMSINSCDQVEQKYLNFNKAKQDELFRKGWIPNEFTFESMTNICQHTNLDLNTCFFQFNLSSIDLNSLEAYMTPTNILFENPRSISLSKKLPDKINKLDHYFFIDKRIPDTLFVAIDRSEKLIYGWRK